MLFTTDKTKDTIILRLFRLLLTKYYVISYSGLGGNIDDIFNNVVEECRGFVPPRFCDHY